MSKKPKLTVKLIKETICPEFLPVRNTEGKVVCKHLFDGEFCEIPEYFRCELIQWKERQKPHTSVSRVGTFLGCPVKFMPRYIDHRLPSKAPGYFFLGREFHSCRARIDAGREWRIHEVPAEFEKTVTEGDLVKLHRVLLWYEWEKARFPVNEYPEFTTTIETPAGRTVLVYLDGLEKGTGNILEYKYAVGDYDHLSLRRQFGIYLAARPQAERCTSIVVKKPTIRPRKGESMTSFTGRVDEWIADKGFGGMVEISEFGRDEFPVEDELRGIDVVHDMADICIKTGIWPGNNFQCDRCEHRPDCKAMY